VTDHDVGDVRELDRRALAAAGEIIAAVRSDDLDKPTPCRRWPLAGLLEHLVSENRGYAASALGAPAIVSIWYSGNRRAPSSVRPPGQGARWCVRLHSATRTAGPVPIVDPTATSALVSPPLRRTGATCQQRPEMPMWV
jgi:hypothetical protein